jgi:hypothetical protein
MQGNVERTLEDVQKFIIAGVNVEMDGGWVDRDGIGGNLVIFLELGRLDRVVGSEHEF